MVGVACIWAFLFEGATHNYAILEQSSYETRGNANKAVGVKVHYKFYNGPASGKRALS